MKKKQSTNTLIRKMDKDVAEARKDYNKRLATRKEGTEIAKQLPGFITSIGWYAFRKEAKGEWYLETWSTSDEEGDKLIRQLKIWGMQKLKSKFAGGLSNRWQFEGVIMVGDIELTIRIDGGSKPPNCTIEEIKEFKEVITYKAICEETGEEV